MADEDLFWNIMARRCNSISGHIKHVLDVDSAVIKKAHVELAHVRRAQTAFNGIATASAFKRVEGNELAIPLCPVCSDSPMSWPHFSERFKLDQLTLAELKDVEMLAMLARCYETFLVEGN